MAIKKGKEIPTIDCALVTLKPNGQEEELALDTASNVAVEVQTETTESTKLIIKGVLKAQKPETTTITGNAITLTDNVFNPQLVLILQGGTIKKEELTGEIKGYSPPTVGSKDKGKIFTLCCYSAIYNAAGVITGYEKISYPNCQGVPVALSSEDNVFRAPEYTINSFPNTGEAPYTIDYVDELPTVADYTPEVG